MHAVREFLVCATPEPWVEAAVNNQSLLLIDHANCEKKAAATAMNLMYRYTTLPVLLTRMSQLAREELLHFQQVVEIMAAREIRYVRLSPSRYAAGLRELVDYHSSNTLVDTLIMGAYIEARSCERFACLVPRLDAPLAKFYRSLLKSEARHFQDYLNLAESIAGADISARVARFGAREAELVSSPDPEFRFHSGVPA